MENKMDDILLLDAIERYHNGEMTEQEKIFLEELRKNNPDIDQMAVEHLFFLQQLQNTADIKAYRHSLNEIENKLVNEGLIAENKLKRTGKLLYLWNRSKRTIAVAACIAGLVSIFTAGMFSAYNSKKSESVITPLVDTKIKEVTAQLKKLENKVDTKLNQASVSVPVKPKFVPNFRATGFLVDVSGYIITNAHVINNAKNLVVENKKGDQFFAKPVYVNATTDLAILKIKDSLFKNFIGCSFQ